MPHSPLEVKEIPTKSLRVSSSRDDAASADAARQQESAPTLVSPYDEAQCDEIEALRAIFMDDYEQIETKSAWSRTSQRSFKLRLRASSDPSVRLILGVTLTTTYPKSVPLLHLEDVSGLRHRSLEAVQSVLRDLPLQLIGEVMINEVAVAIQEALEDGAALQAQESLMPSLEQERAESEAAAARMAQEKEAEQRRMQEQEQAEEDRIMQRMLDEELKRRKDARKRRDVASSDSYITEPVSSSKTLLTFDQPIRILSEDAADLAFRSVNILGLVSIGKLTDVFTATPVLQKPSPVCLVLKRARIVRCRRKEAILSLEEELEKLKSLRHSNTINILDFKMYNEGFDWNIDVLTEHATNGSLRDLLQMVDSLGPSKARNFAIDILQSLDFYHKNGLVHGRVHCGNVLLTALPNGATMLKVADAAFQDTLSTLKDDSKERQPSARKEVQAWRAPELIVSGSAPKTRKTDIWEFGTIFVEMIFGQSVYQKFSSPQSFLNGAGLSDPLEDMMRDVLRPDAKKRPSAFDIIPYEFLRTDAPALNRSNSPLHSRTASSTGINLSNRYLPRQDSQHASSSSRYHTEWNEAGRLGRGGYGEVVKARNKLDGRIYAVKKITNKSPAELSQVLSEVYLLATLNHPYIVRYFTAWPEDEVAISDEFSLDFTSSSDINAMTASDAQTSFAFGQSTGGLDFISSSGYPRIEFGDDDDDEDDEENAVNSDGEQDTEASHEPNGPNGSGFSQKETPSTSDAQLEIQRTRSESRAVVKSTLYIQMEYCERLTLRDMIRRGTFENLDDLWRLLRQILEGLVHIHSHHIIHRDLKPENIFIDVGNNPKIGDFGLATSGQYYLADSNDHARNAGGDMTRSIGTTFYVAPELRSHVSGHYTEKVDMYSLGIILFEMCHPLKTGMERYHTLTALRERDHRLPDEFMSGDKQAQGQIIQYLIKHRPSERPSSAELLRSSKLPLQVEDETIRLALHGLNDPSSPYYHKMLSALFAPNNGRQIRDQMWEMSGDHIAGEGATEYMLLQGMVQDRMVACFRRHGAVESKRQTLFPRSDYYTGANVVQLLDSSGTLVQLPFDLTLPHARAIAKEGSIPERSFAFGTVFREAATGSAPRSGREADFDVVSHDITDNALREAEVIKVMDEIIDELPSFSKTAMCYHINHSRLLEIILDFCRISQPQQAAAKGILSKLNIQSGTWSKIRSELRAPAMAISSTSLDELAQFDFRDNAKKAQVRLQAMLAGSRHKAALEEIFEQMQRLDDQLKLIGVRRPIYWSPLSSFNDKFYKDAVMFQCLFDGKKRDVLAAGGRYDSLVEEHRPKFAGATSSRRELHAVGISIAWDRLITSMLRYQKQGGNAFLKKGEEIDKSQWTPRRCDCLVASFDSKTLRSTGVQILRELWAHDISAELAIDTRLPEELLAHYRDEKHSWIIIVKHDVNATKPDIKVKNMDRREDVDVRSSELMSYMRGEIRDRDQREGSNERAKLSRYSSAPDPVTNKNMGPVTILQTNFKRKIRLNKWREVEAAQGRVRELTASMVENAPILSVELRDEIMDLIRETRLSDPESWRRVVHNGPPADRDYIQQVHDALSKFKFQYAESTRNSFVYSLKTGSCIHYDLRL